MIRHNTNNNLLRSCKSINIHNKNLPAAQQLVSSQSRFSSSQSQLGLGWVIFLDLILFGLVVSAFFYDILTLLSNLIDLFKTTNYDIMCNMTPNSNTREATTVIHSNKGWAQGIKSIFIYGTGALRLHLLRSGGTPLQRGFIIGSNLAADAASTALRNAINDPDYVENHINSWNRVFRGVNNSTLELNVSKDQELNKLTEGKKFLPDDIDFNAISEKIINAIIDHIKPILEPVHVEYTNELLANQIYGISIILFILSIMIIILLVSFIINIIILVYSDKLMNLFTNKYIRWYINFNKKIIGIEICFLGGSLLYFMYMLSYGIHFIATHPIIFN